MKQMSLLQNIVNMHYNHGRWGSYTGLINKADQVVYLLDNVKGNKEGNKHIAEW